MNPYQKKRRWKFFLLIFAIVIGGASVAYTDFFVKKMEREEAVQFRLHTKMLDLRMRMSDNNELFDFFQTMKKNTKIDAIITNKDGSIFTYDGLDTTKTNYPTDTSKVYDSLYFVRQLNIMKKQHLPIQINYGDEKLSVYYKDSFVLTQLRFFPYIQLGVIALFILAAYVAFSQARRAEQDQVWVGMAKETAHQLGTPISSLMAWVELIKARFNAEEDPLIAEMQNDIHRL